MRILVITSGIGLSAAGIVVKSIFDELIQLNGEIEVISIYKNAENYQTGIFHELHGRNPGYTRLEKLLFILTQRNIKAILTIRKGIKLSKKIGKSFKPDVVLVFSSSYGLPMLELGYRISKYFKVPLAIHSFDPIPSPDGWGENSYLRKAISKMIRPYFRYASLVSLTNESMLEFQKKILGEYGLPNSFVLPNPFIKKPELASNSETGSFLFLGSIYGKRDPGNLIRAFENFTKKHSEGNLYFVGYMQPGKVIVPESIKDRVIFIDWTDRPEEYIARCSVLIDLDADIPGDVFISSKLTSYLAYNRIILCITSGSSPSRKFVGHMKETVVLSGFKTDEIEEAMENAIVKSESLEDYSERHELRGYLSPRNVALNLMDRLKGLTGPTR